MAGILIILGVLLAIFAGPWWLILSVIGAWLLPSPYENDDEFYWHW